jgi:selenide,water dikinase
VGSHPDLLVGTGDDAAVWRFDAGRAIVSTADFLTPVVDDAFAWGRAAAVNAASDVYAMGGRPLFALNLVCWPVDQLDESVLGEVLAGAGAAAEDGGWFTVGGHSVDDPEPKFGLAVTGEVDPAHMLTQAGLRAGDVLVLSKPIGVGVITTAVKRGVAPAPAVAAAVASMTLLNGRASEVALACGATGATDVTGFGLLGHLRRMIDMSGVDAHITAPSVPLIDGALELAAAGVLPGGSARNLAWVRERLLPDDASAPNELTLALLADAQTSGGLLFGVAAPAAGEAVAALVESGHQAAIVGEVTAGTGFIRVEGNVAGA